MPALAVADRIMIEDLFIRYTCALDAGDIDTLVACFAEDGSLVSPAVGEHKGRPAIREFAARFARFRERGSQLRHVISNLRAEVDVGQAGAQLLRIRIRFAMKDEYLQHPAARPCSQP